MFEPCIAIIDCFRSTLVLRNLVSQLTTILISRLVSHIYYSLVKYCSIQKKVSTIFNEKIFTVPFEKKQVDIRLCISPNLNRTISMTLYSITLIIS